MVLACVGGGAAECCAATTLTAISLDESAYGMSVYSCLCPSVPLHLSFSTLLTLAVTSASDGIFLKSPNTWLRYVLVKITYWHYPRQHTSCSNQGKNSIVEKSVFKRPQALLAGIQNGSHHRVWPSGEHWPVN